MFLYSVISFEITCRIAVLFASLLIGFLLGYLKRFLLIERRIDVPIVLCILEKRTQFERVMIIGDILGLYSLFVVTCIPLAITIGIKDETHIIGSGLHKIECTSTI